MATPDRRISRRHLLAVGAAMGVGTVAAVGVSVYANARQHLRPTLRLHDTGPLVIDVQRRISGWVCAPDAAAHKLLKINGTFDSDTEQAVRNYQAAYSLPVSGRVDGVTWSSLDALTKSDGSTEHFDWSEFYVKSGPPGFDNGSAPRDQIRTRIQNLMFALEALRLKIGGPPIYIDTGFVTASTPPPTGRHRNWELHSQGLAADVRFLTQHSRADLYVRAETCGFSGLGRMDLDVQHCDLGLTLEATRYTWAWDSGLVTSP